LSLLLAATCSGSVPLPHELVPAPAAQLSRQPTLSAAHVYRSARNCAEILPHLVTALSHSREIRWYKRTHVGKVCAGHRVFGAGLGRRERPPRGL
jgi:hypothetical protein